MVYAGHIVQIRGVGPRYYVVKRNRTTVDVISEESYGYYRIRETALTVEAHPDPWTGPKTREEAWHVGTVVRKISRPNQLRVITKMPKNGEIIDTVVINENLPTHGRVLRSRLEKVNINVGA